MKDEQIKEIMALVHAYAKVLMQGAACKAAGFDVREEVAEAKSSRAALESALRAAVPAIPEGWRLVPVDPTEAMIDAAGRSKAIDDEGAFPSLYDHIDYSGENKTRTVIREALAAAISASPQAPQAAQPTGAVLNTTDEPRRSAASDSI
jgi:hypothetical protein